MQRINYHHLYLLWMVAREGSIAKAARRLHLSQPTISSQISQFEQTVGHTLFDRVGKSFHLTETGRNVVEYAEQIFAIGNELGQYLQGRQAGRGYRLNVGVTDALPKLVVLELLKPALGPDVPVKLHCHEDTPERLLSELSLHAVDLVLATGPLSFKPDPGIVSHLLAESPMAVFGTAGLAAKFGRDFPRSLNMAPFLLSAGHPGMRQDLDRWFAEHGIWPDIRAEISDSALLKTFGGEGLGLFLAPRFAESVITRQYVVEVIGVIDDIREKFFMFTARRKVSHPAVVAILEHTQAIIPG